MLISFYCFFSLLRSKIYLIYYNNIDININISMFIFKLEEQYNFNIDIKSQVFVFIFKHKLIIKSEENSMKMLNNTYNTFNNTLED